MKASALELVRAQTNDRAKLNVLREYVQATILRLLQEKGFYQSAAFLGGTALHFLHGLPRYSEDLDFSQTGPLSRPFSDFMKHVNNELLAANYAVTLNYNDEKTVYSAFIKFEGLLFEAGISPHKSQKFSIKLEIDTNPPAGAVLTTDIVTKYFPLSFLSYDVPSLFAGKIHALLSRKYTKGRDFFDLGWYISKWKGLEPNFTLLTNALTQTGWNQTMPEPGNWKSLLATIVEHAQWKKVEEDVTSFLERPADLAAITQENILKLLRQ